MIDPINTTEDDGAACAECGEDAVVGVPIQGHSREVPLCDTCADHAVTACPGCDQTFWSREGVRIFNTGNLYCRRCAKHHPAVAADLHRAQLRDEARDDFNEVRR